MPVALIFDLDGTLADTRADIAASANAALRAVGLEPIPAERITGFIGDGASVLMERCVAGRRELHGAALAAWAAHYGEHLLDTTVLYPGVEATLAALPGPLAVLTNKPEGMARRMLAALGLAGRFQAVIGGDTLPVKKPDPAGVTRILEATGAPRGVLIGDSTVDLATARAAGIPFWGAGWGFSGAAALREAGAEVIVERFEGIAELRRGVR
ncbi:MAG: HAD-IA family hydrolase [Candidatus Brocadiae bacterium]|nr:HAD-IA family hydrolase [Candidatus Brocadiia bacterium]